MMDSWLSFAYQYGMGGLIFLTGMGLLIRSGALPWRQAASRMLIMSLVGGLVSFAAIHALWITLAVR